MGAKAKGAKKTIHSVDTLAFTESLGLQTFRKGQRKTWVKHDDELLLKRLHELYPGPFEENTVKTRSVDWERVAQAFGGERKAKDCRKRWALSLDPNLRRGKWTPEEDELLVQQFRQHGALWQQVALQIEGRTEHQCLKRYYEVLDPNVRNRLQPWSEAEDLLLIDLVTRHGTKWKTIASEFAGRPSLTCRNRWRNLVTAVVRGRASPAVVEKMAGKFDGNLELLAEGQLPSSESASVPGSGLGLPASTADPDPALDSSHSTNPSPNSVDQIETPDLPILPALHAEVSAPIPAIPMASPAPHKAPWIDTFLRPASVPVSVPASIPDQSLGQGIGQGMSHIPAPSSEWKYTLNGGEGVAENDPVRALLAFGGNIHSEQLANYLLHCASQYNLQVNIHHHHHYPVNERGGNGNGSIGAGTGTVGTGAGLLHQQQQDLPGFAHLHLEITGPLPYFGATPGPEAARVYSLEPEAQLSRFQHFNYLPPLTPVPKLQSSASSPAASSKGSTHHHHHHHHHHGPYPGTARDHHNNNDNHANDNNGVDRDAANSNKESDLFRLLNVGELKREPGVEADSVRPMGKPPHFDEDSRSNSMTPLTQAVQMAAATDAAFYKRTADEFAMSAAKRPHHAPELDFFDPTTPDLTTPQPESLQPEKPRGPEPKLQSTVQPVSQHHPLHYFTSNTTAPPEDLVDEEDEDYLSSWGMYSMRDKPQEPLEISDESNAWFPFNPS